MSRKDHDSGIEDVLSKTKDWINKKILPGKLDWQPYTQQVKATGITTINSTTPIDITGATTTYKPKVRSTVQIFTCFDVQVTGPRGAGIFIGTINISPSPISSDFGQAIFYPDPTAGDLVRWTIPGQGYAVLERDITYTIKLQGAWHAASTVNYTVTPLHTRFTLISTINDTFLNQR